MDHCDELAPPHRRRCDFLLFVQSSSHKGHWVAPIELKGHVRRNDLDGIRDQLQTGAHVAEERLARVGTGNNRVRLRPILGYTTLQPWVRLNLTTAEYQVELRGRTEHIRPLASGNSVKEKLE